MTLEDNLAAIIIDQWSLDSQRYAVVIDDPEADSYEVKMTRYVDADRAGFSGDVSETIATGLTQIEAAAVADKLNAAVAAEKAERAARYAA